MSTERPKPYTSTGQALLADFRRAVQANPAIDGVISLHRICEIEREAMTMEAAAQRAYPAVSDIIGYLKAIGHDQTMTRDRAIEWATRVYTAEWSWRRRARLAWRLVTGR